MFTDPNHLRVEDPGCVEGNPVFIYLDAFCKDEHFKRYLSEYQTLDELKAHYQKGGLGDVKIKRFLNQVLQEEIRPIRERREELSKNIKGIYKILEDGSKKARMVAMETMQEVKRAMKINYFENLSFLEEQEKKYEEK
jgi:tryptophanyl-tRNA synthetase